MSLTAVATPRRAVRPATGLAALPSARAVVGGLLVAIAGLGAFVSWQRASQSPSQTYLVAAGPIPAGTTLTASHLATIRAEVPDGPAAQLVSDPDSLIGRQVARDLASGTLLTTDALATSESLPQRHEVALRLAPEAALGGNIQVADHVLVLTTDESCTAVLAAATVTAVSSDQSLSGGSLITTIQVDDATAVLAIAHGARNADVTLARSTAVDTASFCSAP